LAQETFVRLFKYRDRYEPRARFTTFLYLLARQVRVDLLRRATRHEEGLASYAAATADPGENRGPTLDRIEQAQSALKALPETLRSVVVLGILQELRYEEISAILEIPVGTVKSRMFYALRQLRETLNAGKG
jgi:RNA polymerase sigma-70 factor (ECF subfamily)